MKPHYPRIRRVKTHSGSTAIQVGNYKGKTFQLAKHIGSSKDPNKIQDLIEQAQTYIRTLSPQLEFNFNPHSEEILSKNGLVVAQSSLEEAYTYLSEVYHRLGFDGLNNDLLKHFVLIRVLEPASKIRSIYLLEKYFGIHYKKTTAFRELAKLVDLKADICRTAIAYARKKLAFDFSLIFYDVTTLYFEAHAEDDFRRNGFSKDMKLGQPQVMIGLVVNPDGFPIYWDIFKGNTFEGKTLLPIILGIKQTYAIRKLTVVADAARLSETNLAELQAHQIDYVVGARLGQMNLGELQKVARALGQTDQKIIRHGSMIYEYSARRATKDRTENDKQIERAQYYVDHPGQVVRRSKFIAPLKNQGVHLNQDLIEKHRLLEGIKGYKTSLTRLRPALLVARYKDLWRIEQTFRIAKSDLEARPIYHRKETSIQFHVLIVFIALCLAKTIELETGLSIKRVVDDLRDKWTLILNDTLSGNTVKIRIDQKPH